MKNCWIFVDGKKILLCEALMIRVFFRVFLKKLERKTRNKNVEAENACNKEFLDDFFRVFCCEITRKETRERKIIV